MTVLWADLRRDQVAAAAAAGTVVLLPIGALEQHGPHLPLGTDISAASEVCLRASRRLATRPPSNDASAPPVTVPPVLMLPCIPWGLSPYWMDFPGTITLRPQVLLDLVIDICTSVARHGFQQLLIVNGHGGNDGLLQGAAAQASTLEFRVSMVSYWNLARATLHATTEFDHGSIGHSGEAETSIALHLQPQDVDMSVISILHCVDVPIARRQVAVSAGVYEAPNPRADAPDGVYGRATAGRPDKGQHIIDAAASGLADLIRSMSPSPLRP